MRVSTFVPGIRTNFAGARRSSFWLQSLHWRYGKDNIYRLAGWKRVYAIYDHISVGHLKKYMDMQKRSFSARCIPDLRNPRGGGEERGPIPADSRRPLRSLPRPPWSPTICRDPRTWYLPEEMAEDALVRQNTKLEILRSSSQFTGGGGTFELWY